MVEIFADLMDIARTVFMEAAGEPYEGKLAVAWVIQNRTVAYSQSQQDVIFRSYQFSCWNTDSPTRMNLDDFYTPAWKDSAMAAAAAYFEITPDPTYGASMYYNPDVCSPNWDFSVLQKTVTIGNHVFYKEI